MVDLTEVLGNIDMSAVPLPDDKFKECEYFLELAKCAEDRDEFRWLLSAFLGAAYSYLETKAQNLCNRYYDEQTDVMSPYFDFWKNGVKKNSSGEELHSALVSFVEIVDAKNTKEAITLVQKKYPGQQIDAEATCCVG